MERPRYDSVDEARLGLTGRGVPGDDVERLFDALVPEVDKVVERYDVADDVDLEEVTNGIRIGAASNIALMIDEEIWDVDSCVDRVIKSVQEHESDIEMYASSGSRANRSAYRLYAEMMRKRYVRE